jgi:filamentous hemagglutinin
MGNLFKTLISWVLICILTVQPALLYAQDIQVVGPDDGPRPHVDTALNGTTIINIGTPNSAGVSHDIYTEFTAGDLILNNAATNTTTQLAGWIEGNPNLASGNAASLWIGEVVGGSQTQLNGILEVAGQTMDVVLANEFGITCNGCGFVNTGRATLTTGVPQFDAAGGLSGFDVQQGTVLIEGAGLNPESRLSFADTARVDVIARAAAIYGAMRADQINLVTGANLVSYDWSYDPATGAITGVTEQAGRGAQPALAVDVSALGGMYANAIQMVATEDGVGVRLNGEMASQTNIALRADGQLTLGAPSGGHVPQIRAQNRVMIRGQGPLLLEGSITSETGDLIDIRTSAGALTFTGEASGDAIVLEAAGLATIEALITAQNDLQISSQTGAVMIGANAELAGTNIDASAATTMTAAGKIAATNHLELVGQTGLSTLSGAELTGDQVTLVGPSLSLGGVVTATDVLALTATADGIVNSGSLSGQSVTLSAAAGIGNTGVISAGQSLTATAPISLTNAGVMIAGNDLAIYADQILNNGGVIWANDSITLAANDALDPVSLVQNTNGRIEAFQGDLTIRATEVANIGTAPTISASEIIKWLEQGSADPFDPVSELADLIDPAYLDGNGDILPAYAAAYAALWADVINGGATLSALSLSILSTDVVDGTALSSEFAGRWGTLTARANNDGVVDPAAHVAALVDPRIFDTDGTVLPAYAVAYAELWVTLASGGTTVSDAVKAILDPSALVVESTQTDPVTGDVTTIYSNDLQADATDVWAAMTAGSTVAYDIVKILYQDRFNDDGVLAELVAGGSIDIEADTVRNIFGNISAGEDILITANTVENQALGASQLLLEVHKEPGCFTCHEGEVEFYDTFGGRIEAVGNVNITGNLTNVTLNSSELSLQDVIDQMNAYITEQQVAGDADLTGVPLVATNNLHFHDNRDDDHTAPIEGVAETDRIVIPVDTGANTSIEVAVPVTPSLTPTASLDALLVAGLNTIAETNPEFTEYSNYITSNYMMDVDRLEYRDELILGTHEAILATLSASDVIGEPGPVDYLNGPVQVPSPDGSGMQTIYPATNAFSLSGSGALIGGTNVTITGDQIDNSGTILASLDASITATDITGIGGAIIADTGAVSLVAFGGITFADVVIDGASIDIIAGQDFIGRGVTISSETDTSILATTGVTLTALEHQYAFERGSATMTATEHLPASLTTGGDLSITTTGDLVLAGVGGDIGGAAALTADGDLLLAALQSRVETHSGDDRNGTDRVRITSHVTDLTTGGDFTATAGGQAVLVGAQIDAGGVLQISATEDVVLAAAQDIEVFDTRSSRRSGLFGFRRSSSTYSSTEITNLGVSLAALGDLDIITGAGDLTTAGTSFASGNGDINLTATLGDIYAGAYTDEFREEQTNQRSSFWGLISSSSQSTSVDQISTGTEALAALDLSLVSEADTTLVGASLSAGQNLNINAGGDLSVLAAINSHLSELFSTDMGLITMTTIQERSFVEMAVLTQLLAGQGLSLDIGGDTVATLYTQAGVDAPNPEDLFPEELLALEGLELLTQDLANDYFYDEQTQLSPAFRALVSIAISASGVGAALGNFITGGAGFTGTFAAGTLEATSWLGNAATAFSSSALLGTLDAAVSGNFDLGDILGDAVFAGVSAGLTSGINLDTTFNVEWSDSALQSVFDFGTQSGLSIANLLEGVLDNFISAGLSSVVYGTDFTESFTSSVLSTIVNLAMADVQHGIGDYAQAMGIAEGSLQHAILHGLAGCIAAEAQGANCAAGAAGGIASSLYAGTLEGTNQSDQEQRINAQIIGALVGYIFSGGEAANVELASSVALSAIANNRQLHRTEEEWVLENAGAFAAEQGISEYEAILILKGELLRGVSDNYAHLQENESARAFINANAPSGLVVDGQNLFIELDRQSVEYLNSRQNFATVVDFLDTYEALPPPLIYQATQQVSLPIDGSVAFMLAFDAALDATYFGPLRDDDVTWDNIELDAAATNLYLLEGYGRLAIAAETGEGLAEGVTPDMALITLEAMSQNLLNSVLLNRISTNPEAIQQITAGMTDEQLGYALIGAEIGDDQIADYFGGSGVSARAITLGIQRLGNAFRNNVLAPNSVPDGIWDRGQFTPIQRGNLIEDYLAGTEYSGWTRVGAQNNGFSPAWDFNQGSTWVSLKTVDTAGTGWQSSMRSHIDELSQWSSPTTPNSTRVLDIRVQPGGGASAQSLIDYGAARGVVVRINEF